jgi:hypothetical protein
MFATSVSESETEDTSLVAGCFLKQLEREIIVEGVDEELQELARKLFCDVKLKMLPEASEIYYCTANEDTGSILEIRWSNWGKGSKVLYMSKYSLCFDHYWCDWDKIPEIVDSLQGKIVHC